MKSRKCLKNGLMDRMGLLDGKNSNTVLKFSLYLVGVYGIYIPTNMLKMCQQHSFEFQNFMSSWGSWSKNAKFWLVGYFPFFVSKIFLLKHAFVLWFWKSYWHKRTSIPKMCFRALASQHLHNEREARVDGWIDGIGWMNGV